MKSDVLTLIQGTAKARNRRSSRHDISLSRDQSRTERSSSKRYSIDELAEIAHDILVDKYLEVSKVRPFFWSMVETYADRFQGLPFDPFKALYSHLEMNDFPEEEMKQIISKLEQAYARKQGKPIKPATQVVDTSDTIDDDIRELRDSLAYAALVNEINET